MWKFLLIAFLTRVSCIPVQNEGLAVNWLNPFQTAAGSCICPSSSTTSDQTGSSLGANQPMPFGVGNVGTNFYQNIFVNGVRPAPSPAPSKTPQRVDYTYTPGVGAHKFHLKLSTWNEARKSCNSEGGHLAIINSVAEAEVLVKMLKNSQPVTGATYSDNAYLGIHDLYKDGEWVTIFGQSLAAAGYEKWSNLSGNQPNNLNDEQHCGSLQNDAGFNDVGCTAVLPYFCEQTAV